MPYQEPTHNQSTLLEEWPITESNDMVTVGPCIILVEIGNRASQRTARSIAEHVKAVHSRALHEYNTLKAAYEAERTLTPSEPPPPKSTRSSAPPPPMLCYHSETGFLKCGLPDGHVGPHQYTLTK